MKELGRGWQYTTYDLGNGRVLKKYNKPLRAYAVMFLDALKYRPSSIFKIPAYYVDCKRKAADSMQLIRKGVLDPWMVANPTLLDGLDYEQDHLTPLHERLSTIGEEEGKKLVDDFVVFNTLLLSRSVVDKSFNINKNFGVDKQGRIVLMDLGELFSKREDIEERRRRRPWSSRYVAQLIPNNAVRSYYLEQMDKHFAL